MKKLLSLGMVCFFLFGLVFSVAAEKKPKTKNGKASYSIVLDQSLVGKGLKKSLAAASWLVYSAPIKADMEAYYKDNPDGEYVTPFAVEKNARTNMVTSYRNMFNNMKLTDNDRDAYLEDLGKIHDAGFMNEYVFAVFNKGAWEKPADLKEVEYSEWMKSNLPEHQPMTLGTVQKN